MKAGVVVTHNATQLLTFEFASPYTEMCESFQLPEGERQARELVVAEVERGQAIQPSKVLA